jgi:hypothetical protein
VNQYREGKVKSTPVRGVKQYLKPYAYKQWEGVCCSFPPAQAGVLEQILPDRVPFA